MYFDDVIGGVHKISVQPIIKQLYSKDISGGYH